MSNFSSKVFSIIYKIYLPVLMLFCIHKSFEINDHPFRTQYVLVSDAEGYYLYLPAIFIHGTFENIPVNTKQVFLPFPGTNKVFTKYTYGVAFLEAPFFLAAHAMAKPLGYEADGKSEIYVRAIYLAAIFYGFLGLFFLKKTLEKTFPPWVVFLSSISILLGTNLYYYILVASGMSHVYSFCLFCSFIYLTPKILAHPNWKNVSLFGVIFGLIFLIRPTNGLLLLYPAFYGVAGKDDFLERLDFVKTHFVKLLLFAVMAGLVYVPQLFYWKYLTGVFFFYSYENEGFTYWKNPQLIKMWFSPNNGWLIYTPLMLAPMLGLFFGLKKNENNHLVILVIFVVITYLLASWWFYWFGGALGARSYVEFYALLIFPLAWLLHTSFQKRKSLFIFLILFLGWAIDYSLKINRFHRNGMIWSDLKYGWEDFYKVLERLY